jgi:hypothetical protein
MLEITVEVKSVFGTDTVYPADETARLFCQLTGRKTLTPADLRTIRQLGYAVNVADAAPVRPEWIYGK